MSKIIKAEVFNALNTATIENGYSFKDYTEEQIAIDLITYDALLQDQAPHKIIPYIEEWLQLNPQTI